MTEQEKQALSQAVADKYGIEAYVYDNSYHPLARYDDVVWLHDDWARLMPLAVEQGIDYKLNYNGQDNEACAGYCEALMWGWSVAKYKDHPTKEEAVRIAICRALLEKE